MVLRAPGLSPKVLLSAPRRSSAVPSHDGTLALYNVSTYSFKTKKTKKEIKVMNMKTGSSVVISDDEAASDQSWIPGSTDIMWLRSGEKGNTDLLITWLDDDTWRTYKMDTIEAPFGNPKLCKLADGIGCTFTGWCDYKGSLYNKEIADKPAHTGRLYSTPIVRFWDTYVNTAARGTIWYTKLVKKQSKWSLAAPVHNVLKKSPHLEYFPYDVLSGGKDDYDLSVNGIVFCSTNTISKTGRTNTMVHWLPLQTFVEEDVPDLVKLENGGITGVTACPRFSPSGEDIAYIVSSWQLGVGTRILVLPNVNFLAKPIDLLSTHRVGPDLQPSRIEWAADGENVFVVADLAGGNTLHQLNVYGSSETPLLLFSSGTLSDFYEFKTSAKNAGQLLITSSSYIESSLFSIIDQSNPNAPITLSSQTKNGINLGLSQKQVSEIYFEGAGDYCVQAWVVKPPNFDPGRKYPLALLVHGGPTASWSNAWSTRWNPACWANEGYVVVLPNVTGSTGFGLDFIEGVYNNWGGRPYDDLVKCFDYVEKHLEFVDTDSAIMAGGSYGGYMANWINGSPLGRRFKCIVSHDSVFSTEMLLASDESEDGLHFGGSANPATNHENLERFNPARPDKLREWKTPMLIIHSSGDYRCLEADGLAAYAVCQDSGVECQFLSFPDEGHWVLRPENSLFWHRTVFEWINRFSGAGK